jgi:hypothetical protein
MANPNYVRWHLKPNAKVSEQLARALKPFVDAFKDSDYYRNPAASDLYNEQPVGLHGITLGDCRRAVSVMRLLEENAK